MKTLEEKAKAYDEALERARRIKSGVATDIPDGTPVIEAIFPELKESEDERIKREMLQIAKESEDTFYMVMTPNKRERLIAWLEKQEKPVEWNKADDVMFKELYDFLTYNKTVLQHDCDLYAHWLESLKKRIGG